MISISGTFIVSVMALYVYCKYVLYPELDIAALPWMYTGWLTLHITGTLMIIHYSNSLAKEVNIYHLLQFACILHIKNVLFRFLRRENEHFE